MSSCAISSPFETLIFATFISMQFLQFSPVLFSFSNLDDTLYSSATGIGQALKRNLEDFLAEKLGFSESEAQNMNRELFRTYGSSLAGLRSLGYDINPNDYHSFVHGRLPYDFIKPDIKLRKTLQSIKQRKIILTNSDRIHAMKALDLLGISDCFEKTICFETMNPNLWKPARLNGCTVVLKPSTEAMRIAIDAADVDPLRTLFFDDNVKNIAAGKAVGLRTVLVGSRLCSRNSYKYGPCDSRNLDNMIYNRSEMDSILAPTTFGA